RGRIHGKEFLVGLVHGVEISHVAEIHRHFHDVLQRSARGFQNRANVFQCLPRLRADVGADDLVRMRIERAGAGHVDPPAGGDRLRVVAARRRRGGRFNSVSFFFGFAHNDSSVPFPCALARSYTTLAVQTSSIARPCDLNSVISSAPSRPAFLPSTTSPSSPT